MRVRRYIGIILSGMMMTFVCLGGRLDAQVVSSANVPEGQVSAEPEDKAEEFVMLRAGFYADRQPSISEYDKALELLEGEAEPVHNAQLDETKEIEKETEVDDAATAGVSAEYLALAIESEAGNVVSSDGRVAVGLTALKRVDSPKYPDTLPGVIEQPYQYADLVDSYSQKSYDAAVTAISLWEEGKDNAVLPDGYMYFFGYKSQNWFYRYKDGAIEFYALPGQTITDDVRQAFREIVLKETPTEETQEEAQEAIGETLEELDQQSDLTVTNGELSEEIVSEEATTEVPTVDEVINIDSASSL